ncbi:MAG: hypothetical protein LBJ74_03390 [Heliobacteriaceae bacterium]|jgi:hypothetical protein|nr:hypothetical protein [Heliobacteriaceae bacterium]
MGIPKINIQAVRSWAKACGGSVLRSKPQTFHGINPTITYPKTGKTFELPRFISEEMKVARNMNKIAINQAKNPIKYEFPKATAEDLKRLTSETIKASYKRVAWTNPKDGKVYHLLEQSRTKDGKVLVRILDHEGAFVKEAALTPKTVAIIDERFIPGVMNYNSHGSLVSTYARRNNPFAQYEFHETHVFDNFLPGSERSYIKSLNKVLNSKADYLSISIGTDINITQGKKGVEQLREIVTKTTPDESDELIKAITKKGTRVLISSGNDGKDVVNHMLVHSGAEGVGSISLKGKVSEFSASRNSSFTQHYELGEYNPKYIYKGNKTIGINFTETPGCDIKYRTPKELNRIKETFEKKIAKIKNELEVSKKEAEDTLIKRKQLGRSISDMKKSSKLFIKWKKLNYKKDLLDRKCWQLKVHASDIEDFSDRFFRINKILKGTSLSTPIRTAKLALNDMMQGVL